MYLHSNSTQILALKKNRFFHFFGVKKGIMQLFSADAVVFSKKLKFFFDPERVKKRISKVAHNRPRTFYFIVQPRSQPRIDFSYLEILGPDIWSLICVLKAQLVSSILPNSTKLDIRFKCLRIQGIYLLFNYCPTLISDRIESTLCDFSQ